MPSYCYILILLHILFMMLFKAEIYGTRSVPKYPLTPTWFNIIAIVGGLASAAAYILFCIGAGICAYVWFELAQPVLDRMSHRPRRP